MSQYFIPIRSTVVSYLKVRTKFSYMRLYRVPHIFLEKLSQIFWVLIVYLIFKFWLSLRFFPRISLQSTHTYYYHVWLRHTYIWQFFISSLDFPLKFLTPTLTCLLNSSTCISCRYFKLYMLKLKS
jgi:hypothetical protein